MQNIENSRDSFSIHQRTLKNRKKKITWKSSHFDSPSRRPSQALLPSSQATPEIVKSAQLEKLCMKSVVPLEALLFGFDMPTDECGVQDLSV